MIAEANLVVAEIYSPPRVTRAARILRKLGITPGFALDITVQDEDGQPWDFEQEAQRCKALALHVEMEPDLVVGSPACK